MRKTRCDWAGNSSLYIDYHDKEWGVPVYDDATIFEFLTLETFQAGLSWLTVLKKRNNFRQAFDNFDYRNVAKYGDDKIEELINNAGIIRNRLKILAAISNASAFIDVRNEFETFSKYIWGFTGGKAIKNTYNSMAEVPANTELSDTISKDLKFRGFKFVGSTVVYAHIQATGMVNDHLTSCFRYNEV